MPQFLPFNTLADGDEFRDANGNVIETFNPDVQTTPPVSGDALTYNGTQWVPMAAAGGGGNPIGSIIQSILTQAEINIQEAGTWQLCDGTAITAGSALATLNPTVLGGNVPNAQGRFLGGAGAGNTGAAAKTLGNQLGTQNVSHTHTTGAITGTVQARAPFGGGAEVTAGTGNTADNTGASGGDEARPFTYVVNHFIKIN